MRDIERQKLVMMAVALTTSAVAQTSGPRSPGTTANDAGVGANAWSSTASSVSSNDSYATVATKGISNYLKVTNFGFTIPTPSGVAGIQLDVERSTTAATDVVLLDAWSTGTTKTISAGTNRCLVVTYVQENGTNSRDLTALTYGGRAMTQAVETAWGVSGGFMARIEVWVLSDAEIALAGSTTISPTFGSYTALEYCDLFSSATFQNVDQLSPVAGTQASGAQGTSNPHQLGTAFTTSAGSMAINLVTCGNRDATNPAANVNTTSYSTPAGYTEGTDYYFANAGVAPTSGASYQVIHKAVASAGTEQPACTFNGTVNRYAIVGFCLQRPRELDYSVKLVKGGTIGGTDLANTISWPNADGYVTYGGATNTWGRSWTDVDINASTFGAAISSRVQNGTSRVDHLRITVYYYSTLPIELVDFRVTPDGPSVRLDWITATESGNDHFIVQRSRDGVTFEEVTRLPGAGNSASTLYYHSVDEAPLPGTSYYRLDQVDVDGTTTSSQVVPVDRTANELVVFPNPSADGVFTIHDIHLEQDQVAVYTDDMRLVRTHVGAGADPVIHLEDLPDGTYVLMVRTGERVRTTRVVKTSRTR